MIEITWRHDPSANHVEHVPDTGQQAIDLLIAGNAAFCALEATPSEDSRLVLPVTAEDLGFGEAGHGPSQAPFAALLGCADARVPLELITCQSANDVFVVRVAGNVLGAECVGSLDYALAHLPTVRVLAVIGHTGCGAVAAAVDAYLAPDSYLAVSHNLPLRAIVDAIMATVRGADAALREKHGPAVANAVGYRSALIDTAVVLNAAVAASALRKTYAHLLGEQLSVAFGAFDLGSRSIGIPGTGIDAAWAAGLFPAPGEKEFPHLASDIVSSTYVARLLGQTPAAH